MILAITGGTGTLGHALVDYLKDRFDKIYIISRDELKQHEMERDAPDNVRFFIGDVRDRDRMSQLFKGVYHVIHAAALKQVPRCEYNPTEAVKTNVYGSSNVIDACISAGVERCVLVSTDKAVNPINLYGSTKLCAEKLFLAANQYNETSFGVVRYGNVIGSRGSLAELVEKCKKEDKIVPLTHADMTRFWMTKQEAAKLVYDCLIGKYRERPLIFCARRQKVMDFIRDIWPGSTLEQVGIRPGEKLHEFLAAYNEEVWVSNGETVTAEKGPICSAQID